MGAKAITLASWDILLGLECHVWHMRNGNKCEEVLLFLNNFKNSLIIHKPFDLSNGR